MSTLPEPSLRERALRAIEQRGNPFRQQFARNSDDASCSLYHVDDLFALERRLITDLVESYRGQPDRPTSVFTLLGPRGAGKTHLLHCLKHGPGVAPQLFVTPGTFRIDHAGSESSFLEYLLYQLINVLLAGDKQRGARPFVYVGEQLTQSVLKESLGRLDAKRRVDLFAANGVLRLSWKLGLGCRGKSAVIDQFVARLGTTPDSCRALAQEANIDLELLTTTALQAIDRQESRDLRGELRRQVVGGFVRATLLGDEVRLADFLTDGFAEVPFQVPPTRAQLTLTLLQTLTEVIVGAGIPIAVAFDQLEELLYGQTDDEVRRSSDAFFGGIVQLQSQVPGLCVLLFVEEGLWNRIVPPLAPHILDRIQEPIHVPGHGTVRQARLSAPTAEQLAAVVSCRVRRTLADASAIDKLPAGFPFGLDFLEDISRRETVLRLMLQACCNRLDEMFDESKPTKTDAAVQTCPAAQPAADLPQHEQQPVSASTDELAERWHQEVRTAERKLKPVGSLSGSTAELQGGLARWLRLCKMLGVQQDDWRMAAIHDQIAVGDHPTYGTLTVVEWVNDAQQHQRVGIGLWLGRGVGKPRDLETKLRVFDHEEVPIDHLILLRPADDARLTGKSKAAWDQTIAAGRSLRLEPVDLEVFAKLHAFPQWMQQVHDSYPDDQVPESLYLFLAEQTGPIIRKLALPTAEEELRQAS